jgi:trimeric autotransporter adhesin
MRSRAMVLLTALALLAGLWASAPTRAQEEPTQPVEPKVLRPQAANDARIRLTHGVQGGPAVDVYVGSNRVAAGIPFGFVSDYLETPPGTAVNIRVLRAGELPSAAPLANATFTPAAGAVYSCTVYPTATGASSPIAISCDQDNVTGLAAGDARLAVYHFSPDVAATVPAVDIRNAATNAVLIDDLAFEQVAFVDVPAGTVNLKLTDPTGAVTALAFNNVHLEAGLIYSLFAVGNPLTSNVVPNKVTSANAQVRVVHAVANGPNVDVYLDGGATPVLRDVPFFDASEYLSVPAGSRSFRITQTGQTTTLIGPVNVTLEPGKAYTVVARGDASNLLIPLSADLFFDDLSSPVPGAAKVRVFHLSQGAPNVSLLLNGLAVPGVTVGYGSATPYLQVPARTNNLTAVVASGPSAGAYALTLPNVEMFGDAIYDVFVVDTPARLRGEIRVTDTGAYVRVVHAAPTAGAVDVYVGGVKELSAVAFQSISSYRFLDNTLYRVQVFAAGANPATATPVLDSFLGFEKTKKYTIAVRNNVAPATGVTADVFTDNQMTPASGDARVNVYHLSTAIQALSAGGVDVIVVGGPLNGTKLVDDLQLGQLTTFDVPIGSYTVQITAANGTTPIGTPLPVTATGRYVYDLFAIDTTTQPTVISSQRFPFDVPVYEVSLPVIFR